MQFTTTRRLSIAAAALMALSLAACDQAKEGFDKGFNEKFEQSTHDSCVKAAVAGGAPTVTANAYCTCFTAEMVALPMDEKLKLNTSNPKVTQAAEKCRSQVMQ